MRCERISYRYEGDQANEFFFDGHTPARPACDDGIDNEGDGKVDTSDPDCDYSSQGTSEGLPPTACAAPRSDSSEVRSAWIRVPLTSVGLRLLCGRARVENPK